MVIQTPMRAENEGPLDSPKYGYDICWGDQPQCIQMAPTKLDSHSDSPKPESIDVFGLFISHTLNRHGKRGKKIEIIFFRLENTARKPERNHFPPRLTSLRTKSKISRMVSNFTTEPAKANFSTTRYGTRKTHREKPTQTQNPPRKPRETFLIKNYHKSFSNRFFSRSET